MKSQEKSGLVKGFSIIFIHVREKSGKKDYLVHISFSLTLCMVICKVVVRFLVSKFELYHFA